jgi:hypothetical protein
MDTWNSSTPNAAMARTPSSAAWWPTTSGSPADLGSTPAAEVELVSVTIALPC